MGKLTVTEVKQFKGRDKDAKLSDGGGPYLLIKPKGTKYWRYNYRYAGKRKTLALWIWRTGPSKRRVRCSGMPWPQVEQSVTQVAICAAHSRPEPKSIMPLLQSLCRWVGC
jgi:hypothetical protein